MRVKTGFLATATVGLLMSSMYLALAQRPAPAGTAEPERVGGFVPGQKRAPIDPVLAAHGKALYGVNCQACHGKDLRGGDMGGPNLLRSQVTLTDQNGELIVPIIQGSRQALGMPAIGISIEDSNAVAAYVRSVIATIGAQGTPPGKQEPPSIVVGNATDGRTYFASTCAKCHSAEGDLRGIASRIVDPKQLQATWLMGGGRSGISNGAVSKVSVLLPSGATSEGDLVRMDDFLVTLKSGDGTTRSFRRNGDLPKVTLTDPLKAHKDMLSVYTDKNIHDVTAYLVTLK
ncbi:MAG: cytochrome c, class [Acidobacteriaceae bacterium]|nr:cytochrome c, class [Acidobacteriaceae bacterium]